MPSPSTARRIAIAQIPMHRTVDANLAAMLGAMARAHAHGAAICAFSELAITGFHRGIVEQGKPELVLPAVERVRQFAARLRQAVAFGAPTFGRDGAKCNSHLLVDETGRVAATVDKNGLTPAEATFFRAGTTRPVALLHGLRTTAVICREVEDHEHVLEQLRADPVQLVLWPGLMSPDPAKPVAEPPEHVAQAQRLARAAGAYVVQTNWPNSLNYPEKGLETGQSACISPSGELMFRLPKQGFGLGLFTLGESAFEWHPSSGVEGSAR